MQQIISLLLLTLLQLKPFSVSVFTEAEFPLLFLQKKSFSSLHVINMTTRKYELAREDINASQPVMIHSL